MKKIALGLLALTLITTGIQAQDKPVKKTGKENKMHKGPGGYGKKGGLYKDLNLSQDQKDQITKINAEHKAALQDLKKKENSITVADHKEQMKAIRKTRHEKVQNILTVEQKEKLANKRAAHMGKRNAHFNGRKGKGAMANLNLSDEQSAQVKAIRTKTQQKIKGINENNTLNQNEKKKQTIAAFKQQSEEVKTLLTPEQVKKMEDMPQRGPRHISK